MGLMDVLEIARQGLDTQREAMNTTSNNIANVNTPNYSRQRAELAAKNSQLRNNKRQGGGVEVSRIIRVHDRYVQKQIFDQTKVMGDLRVQNDMLHQMENYLQNAGKGVGEEVNHFFQTYRELSVNPEKASLRFAVKEAAYSVSKSVSQMSNYLGDFQRDMHIRLEQNVEEVNSLAEELGAVNLQISNLEALGRSPNELKDNRDGLLQKLSSKLGFDANKNERGQVNIVIPGIGPLVTGGEVNKLIAVKTPADEFTDSGLAGIYVRTKTGMHNITGALTQGEIAGILTIRDEVIENVDSHLDELAFNFSNAVNNLHREGAGMDGESDRDLFQHIENKEGAASNLRISDQIQSNPENIATGYDAGKLGDNRIATAMGDLESSQLMRDMNVNLQEGEEGITRYSIGESLNMMIGSVGHRLQNNERLFTQQEGLMDQLHNYRESLSGVSLEEEAMRMMQYQTAFNAAAKTMKIGDELLDVLMNLKD